MRWQTIMKNGDLRVKKRFLLFPTRIKNETVWLENVYILQKVVIGNPLFDDNAWWWANVRYVNVEIYNKFNLMSSEGFKKYIDNGFMKGV